MRHALKAARHLREADPVLARAISAVGTPRIRLHACHPFESLVSAIVYQQLSGKAAATIYGRLKARAGEMTPEALARLTDDEIRGAGISSQKLKYLRDLGQRTRDGAIPFQRFQKMDDAEILEALVEVKGIGLWTAQIFLMFALGRPDVLPAGDLGLQKSVRKLYGLRKHPDPDRLLKIGERWRPWRTVASWYLWKYIDGTAEVGDL